MGSSRTFIWRYFRRAFRNMVTMENEEQEEEIEVDISKIIFGISDEEMFENIKKSFGNETRKT